MKALRFTFALLALGLALILALYIFDVIDKKMMGEVAVKLSSVLLVFFSAGFAISLLFGSGKSSESDDNSSNPGPKFD